MLYLGWAKFVSRPASPAHRPGLDIPGTGQDRLEGKEQGSRDIPTVHTGVNEADAISVVMLMFLRKV